MLCRATPLARRASAGIDCAAACLDRLPFRRHATRALVPMPLVSVGGHGHCHATIGRIRAAYSEPSSGAVSRWSSASGRSSSRPSRNPLADRCRRTSSTRFRSTAEGRRCWCARLHHRRVLQSASNAGRHPPRKRALTRRKRIRFTDTPGNCQIPGLGSSIHGIGFKVQYVSRKRVHLPLSRRESDLYFGLNASVGMNNP